MRRSTSTLANDNLHRQRNGMLPFWQTSQNFKRPCMGTTAAKFRLFSTADSSSSSDTISVVSNVSSPSPIDAGSSIRKPVSLWPGMYHSPVTNALWEARSNVLEKSDDAPSEAISQGGLTMKTPSSRTSISYKFSSDPVLREQYRNPWNQIRMGKVVEDLDALAGTISFKVRSCSQFAFIIMQF
ncbi:unnamed protein product [Rhodiola kirilowii]